MISIILIIGYLKDKLFLLNMYVLEVGLQENQWEYLIQKRIDTLLIGDFLDKKIFLSCIIFIAVIALFSPTIISTLMLQQNTILNTQYYIQYIANLLSFHLSLFFLASLVLVLFLKKG
ncbi:hypothetical protein AO843_02695 [Lysinibacillus sp. ZYM-1]|nr:hypothetical protein AO843_02695 [Lysinibacillus sp. ZYM-1]